MVVVLSYIYVIYKVTDGNDIVYQKCIYIFLIHQQWTNAIN